MREIRKTFEHLAVITGVIFVILAIIFAIPGIRAWVFNNAPAAVVGVAGTGAVSSLMMGVDPHMLASAVNDDKTRAELIVLWKKSIPEVEPDAMADMLNQVLSDPNVSATIVDVIAELDPDKMAELYNALLADPAVADHLVAVISKLDPTALSNFTNELIGSEGTANLIIGLINGADNKATADLVNKILNNPQTAAGLNEVVNNLNTEAVYNFSNALIANPGTAQLINGLIDIFAKAVENNDAGSQALSSLVNQMLANPNTPVMINAFIDSSDTEKVAELLEKIMDNPGTVEGINTLIAAFDPSITSNVINQLLVDENGKLSDFINALIDNSDSAKVASLVNKILENEQTVTQLDKMLAGLDSETTGQFLQKLLSEPGTVNLLQDLVGSVKADGVIARLLNDEDSGLRKVMWGETGKNDAILDWLYVEIKMEQSLTSNGLDVVEYWESYLHPIMDPLCLGWLVPTLAKLIGEGQGGYVEDSYQFVRVSDIFFGTPDSFQAYLDSRVFPAHILPDQ